MKTVNSTLTVLWICAATLLLANCVFYTERERTLQVVDTDTGKPLAHHRLEIRHLDMVYNFGKMIRPVEVLLDENGSATCPVPMCLSKATIEYGQALIPGEMMKSGGSVRFQTLMPNDQFEFEETKYILHIRK